MLAQIQVIFQPVLIKHDQLQWVAKKLMSVIQKN